MLLAIFSYVYKVSYDDQCIFRELATIDQKFILILNIFDFIFQYYFDFIDLKEI